MPHAVKRGDSIISLWLSAMDSAAEEVVPKSQSSGYGDLATMGVVFGFVVMVPLDVAWSTRCRFTEK